MALFDDSQSERTLKPTSRRRRQARERGSVARSIELVGASRMLALWALLAIWVPGFVLFARNFLLASFQSLSESAPSASSVTAEAVFIRLREAIFAGMQQVALPLGVVTLAIVVAHFGQVGWMWRLENVAPDACRLSPARGLTRWLSIATFGRIGAIGIKTVLIATLANSILHASWSRLVRSTGELSDVPSLWGSVASCLTSQVAVTMLIWGLLDYFLQRWRHERSLRMTPQEMRDELKELEGHPLQRRRR